MDIVQTMDDNLFRYIWRHSKRDQVGILLIVLFSFVFFYLSLELPKTIVNEAIQGDSFPDTGSTAPFLRLVITLPAFLGGETVILFEGIALERIPYLWALSGVFLALVIVNNGFKRQINTMKGRLGERMLRRLRYELFDRILRFPLPHFRKAKSTELATMIKDEVEPLGGFIGDAFVTPAFLGGQALTALIFILVQNVYLGAVVVAVVLVQVIVIPKLRVRLLKLGRERQLTARQLAGRIAECADGIQEIRVNGTSNFERADVTARLGRIFDIRLAIYQRKFSVKALNNFLAQVPPFVFFSVGGYLAIVGSLDIGALVAVIAAYKDLPNPIRDLIDWDQQRLDVQIKYQQVIEQFKSTDMIDPARQAIDHEEAGPLTGPIRISNLSYTDDLGRKVLDRVSLALGLDDRVAVLGPTGQGKSELAMIVAGLLAPTSGRVLLGDVDLSQTREWLIGRRFAYAGPGGYLFPVSVGDNALYGLRQRPVRPATYGAAERTARDRFEAEARRAGNCDFDPAAEWIDYGSVGVTDEAGLTAWVLRIMRLLDFDRDLYEFGLATTVDPVRRPLLTDSVLAARAGFARRLADPALAALVEPLHPDRFNGNATVGENLLFGSVVGTAFDPNNLARNPFVRAVLDRAELTADFLAIGREMAETVVELFADLSLGDDFVEQHSYVTAADLPMLEAVLDRLRATGLDRLALDDRIRLLSLPFKLIAARHRLVTIDESLQRRIVAARRIFADELPPAMRDSIEFFDPAKVNSRLSLRDNILFGRIVQTHAEAGRRVDAVVAGVLDELGQRAAVTAAGLDYAVGVGGTRLSAAQRQKLAIARALVKRPDFLIMNEATAALDSDAERQLVEAVAAEDLCRGVLWVLRDPSLAPLFDRVLEIAAGSVREVSTRVVGEDVPAPIAMPLQQAV